MIALSSTEITKAYLGSAEIDKIYLGEDLVFGGSPTPVVPYDAEIEYLQGDGNAYIKVPFIGHSQTTTFSLDFIADSVADNCSLLGSRTTLNGRFCWVISPTNTITQVGYGSSYENVSINVRKGDVINCTTSISSGVITYTIRNITNGTSASTSWSLSSYEVNSFIYLFWASALNKSKCSVTRLWIANNGAKVVDCIPVRVGNVGYMYDKVSGKLFGNDGTGSFTLGPDVT